MLPVRHSSLPQPRFVIEAASARPLITGIYLPQGLIITSLASAKELACLAPGLPFRSELSPPEEPERGCRDP